jgi:glycosyltransferase involved in cell wall biosynthesis
MTDGGAGRHPQVSVVIPTYNCATYVNRTIDSVIAQTSWNWELVVLDDGSTDGTAELAGSYAARDARIRVVRTPNGGVARARNRGFAATDPRSEFVTFLDHDDRWLPGTLETMTNVLYDRPDLVSVYGLARCIDSDDQPVPGDDLVDRMRERFEYRGRRLVPIGPREPTTFAGLVHHNYPLTPGLHLVRRNVIDVVGGFDPAAVPADDWDMAVRIARIGPIGFLDRVVLEWRRHADVFSAQSPGWRRAFYHVRAKTYLAPQNTPDQTRLARTAYLSPARESLSVAWSRLRDRQIRTSGRAVVNATDGLLHLAAASARRRLRSSRIDPVRETFG